MIPTNLSPVAKQLPEYLFYKLPNNKGYRMFTTKPTAISHTFDLNIGKKTLTDAINIKFDRDYKGTQLIKKLFNLQEIHCRSNPDVLTVNLEKKNVKSRIAAYDEYYKRMCPGYQRGEILMRREKLFNLGILSYKTNTPKSMRFNVLGLMNYMNTELLIGMSCDLENAFDALPKFTAMLQSIEVNE